MENRCHLCLSGAERSWNPKVSRLKPMISVWDLRGVPNSVWLPDINSTQFQFFVGKSRQVAITLTYQGVAIETEKHLMPRGQNTQIWKKSSLTLTEVQKKGNLYRFVKFKEKQRGSKKGSIPPARQKPALTWDACFKPTQKTLTFGEGHRHCNVLTGVSNFFWWRLQQRFLVKTSG